MNIYEYYLWILKRKRMVFGDVITFVSYVRQWFPIKIDNVEKETAIGEKKKGNKACSEINFMHWYVFHTFEKFFQFF